MENKAIWHNLSAEEGARILGVKLKEGVSEKEAKARQKKFGKNLLPEEKSLSTIRILLEQFRSPLIYILVLAGIITLFFRVYTDAIVIFGAVILNAIVGFFQENKSSQALRELKKIVRYKTQALREGKEKIIGSEGLVLGDVFFLNPGDKVSADGRLIETYDLKIDESALTGEWISAKKKIDILKKETPLADRDNMVYMGTVVEEGKAKAITTAVGLSTEIGKIAQIVRETKEEKTPLQKKLSAFAQLMTLIIGIICVFIFAEGVLVGKEPLLMFETAVAVAVAAIPEGLPVAMTVILALGMQRILKRKGLVRKLLAAEALGSTSIIATDKTGTLTEAKMQVAGVYTGAKELLFDGQDYSDKIEKDGRASNILALKIAVLCSEAFIENPEDALGKWVFRGRPTDKALLLAGVQAGLNKKELEKEEPKTKELPFDPVVKYSASLHELNKKENILYVLGAPEVILAASKKIQSDGEVKILSEEEINGLNYKFEELASKGQRILATAYKKISQPADGNQELTIDDLIFVGLISLHDPLRRGVKEAIKICREAGMRPIIITGDHKLTAKAIAEELDLPVRDRNIIEGKDLEKISDGDFQKRLNDIMIYARVEPRQKLRIVQAWQNKGEVIAMTGDGINDTPALKKADIGVALGSGTDVAKEAADLILLTDDFSIIVAAIEEGRAIIDNVRKVITYLLSDSFTEIILIGTSLILGWPLPILAVQILWVNLIEDGPLGISLSFEPKEKDVMQQKSQGLKIPLLTTEMKALIFIIGIITDFLLLGLFFWLISYSNYEIPHIQSIMFAGLTIGSIFYIFSCKSLRKNIWQINLFSNKFLIISWFFSVLALLAALYIPVFQILLKTVPLNIFDWVLILGLGLLNLILIEVTKWYFIVRKETY